MFFVTSTLSLLGCPQDNTDKPPETPSTPVASVPQTDSGPLPSTPEPSTPSPEPPATAKVPPLDVPTDVNDTAKQHFEWLATSIPAIHKDIDQLDKLTASLCAIDDVACDKTWSDIARLSEKVKESRKDLEPRCGRGKTPDAERFNERLDAHQAALDVRLKTIRERIDRTLDTDPKRTRWTALQSAHAPPRVCLKFRCPEW